MEKTNVEKLYGKEGKRMSLIIRVCKREIAIGFSLLQTESVGSICVPNFRDDFEKRKKKLYKLSSIVFGMLPAPRQLSIFFIFFNMR